VSERVGACAARSSTSVLRPLSLKADTASRFSAGSSSRGAVAPNISKKSGAISRSSSLQTSADQTRSVQCRSDQISPVQCRPDQTRSVQCSPVQCSAVQCSLPSHHSIRDQMLLPCHGNKGRREERKRKEVVRTYRTITRRTREWDANAVVSAHL
jgi:hypothetical protein